MIFWIKKNRATIFASLLVWWGVGALFGLINTVNARTDIFTFHSHDYTSGCDYTSLSGLLNPGYVLVCELGRARWHWEPGGLPPEKPNVQP
jgi:hypothetical protein